MVLELKQGRDGPRPIHARKNFSRYESSRQRESLQKMFSASRGSSMEMPEDGETRESGKKKALSAIPKLQTVKADSSIALPQFSMSENIVTVPDGRRYMLGRQIGSGSFGIVFEAVAFKKDGSLEKKPSVAFKFLKRVKAKVNKGESLSEIEKMQANYDKAILNLAKAESQKFSDYYGDKDVSVGSIKITSSDKIKEPQDIIGVTTMPLLPGQEIREDVRTFSGLSLARRLQFINEILFSVNTMHHHHPDRSAIAHKDIKVDNILYRFRDLKKGKFKDTSISEEERPKEGAIDVYPIDFGLSDDIKTQDSSSLQKKTLPAGTQVYMAPEVAKRKGGVKSDIYSLTPIVALILGAEEPFYQKMEAPRDIENEPFDFYGILSFLKKSAYPHPLEKWVLKFLERMSDPQYNRRPDINETMKFFLTLNQYVLTAEHDTSDTRDDALLVHASNLEHLAQGTWQQSHDFDKLFPSSKKRLFSYSDARNKAAAQFLQAVFDGGKAYFSRHWHEYKKRYRGPLKSKRMKAFVAPSVVKQLDRWYKEVRKEAKLKNVSAEKYPAALKMEK